MRVCVYFLLSVTLFISSCSTYKSRIPSETTHTGQAFTISNDKGEMLFDVTAPVGIWETYDRSKEKVSQFFEFMYQGPNQGLINAEIRISFGASGIPRTIEESKQETRLSEQQKWLKELTSKPDFKSFYKPKKLVTEIRTIAGIRCGYYSFINHSGPTLDTPTSEFRGMGSARKRDQYLCPVIRNNRLWYLGINIVYQYSDNIQKNGLDIDFYETIKDFDRMLKPTLESLKLYGDLKQY